MYENLYLKITDAMVKDGYIIGEKRFLVNKMYNHYI